MLSSYKYQSIRNGLVGYWRPSRGPTGNLLIDSVKGNNGTLANGPTWQASAGGGNSGYAIGFDGTNDKVTIVTNGLPTTNTATICAWALGNSFSAYRGVLFCRTGGGYGLLISGGGATGREIGWIWDGTEFAENTVLPMTVGQWHFVALTINGPTANLYLGTNGALSSYTKTITSTSRNLSSTWELGEDSAVPGTRSWNGQIDDAMIFNRALSRSEIATLAQAGRGGLDQRVNRVVVRGTSGGGIDLTINSVQSAVQESQPSITATFGITCNSTQSSPQENQPSVSCSYALAHNSVQSSNQLSQPSASVEFGLALNSTQVAVQESQVTLTCQFGLALDSTQLAVQESQPDITVVGSPGSNYSLAINSTQSLVQESQLLLTCSFVLACNSTQVSTQESQVNLTSLIGLVLNSTQASVQESQPSVSGRFALQIESSQESWQVQQINVTTDTTQTKKGLFPNNLFPKDLFIGN